MRPATLVLTLLTSLTLLGCRRSHQRQGEDGAGDPCDEPARRTGDEYRCAREPQHAVQKPRRKLRRNSERFRQQMTTAGFALAGADHPIIPVMIGDAKVAGDMAARLLEMGVFVGESLT